MAKRSTTYLQDHLPFHLLFHLTFFEIRSSACLGSASQPARPGPKFLTHQRAETGFIAAGSAIALTIGQMAPETHSSAARSGLQDALVEFACDAFPLLRSQQHFTVEMKRSWPQEWCRTTVEPFGERFVPLLREIWSLTDGVQAFWTAISQLPSYRTLMQVMTQDEFVMSQMNQLVGTPFIARGLSLRGILFDSLLAPLAAAGSHGVDPDLATRLAREIVTDLKATHLPHTVLVPLLGVNLNTDLSGPDGTVVRKMTDSEISRLIASHALPFHHTGRLGEHLESVLIPTSWQYAVVWSRSFEKVIGDRRQETPVLPDLVEDTDLLIAAIRLSASEPVTRGPLVTMEYQSTVSPQGGGSYGRPDVVTYSLGHKSASVSDCPQLEKTWGQLRESTSRVRIAAKRNADAAARSNPEDALIDLLIALETLLVPEAGSEVALRLSMRGALMTAGATSSSVAAVQAFLKQAYDARSKLVHGSAKPLKLMSLHGPSASVSEFKRDLEVIVRHVLQEAVSQGERFSTFVDDLIPNALNEVDWARRNSPD